MSIAPARWYVNNASMLDKNNSGNVPTVPNRGSLALFDNRLRLAPEIIVSEALSLNIRADALEKVWGDRTWTGASFSETGMRPQDAPDGRTSTQENIEVERAYVIAKTPIGGFIVGYQPFGRFGTSFADTDMTVPGIGYIVPIGPVWFVTKFGRWVESQVSDKKFSAIDADMDEVDLAGVYKFSSDETGVAYKYVRAANFRTNDPPYTLTANIINPYVKYATGPFYIEAEIAYIWGYLFKWEGPGYDMFGNPVVLPDVKFHSFGAYMQARCNVGPAYMGGIFAYGKGDDPRPSQRSKAVLPIFLWPGTISTPA